MAAFPGMSNWRYSRPSSLIWSAFWRPKRNYVSLIGWLFDHVDVMEGGGEGGRRIGKKIDVVQTFLFWPVIYNKLYIIWLFFSFSGKNVALQVQCTILLCNAMQLACITLHCTLHCIDHYLLFTPFTCYHGNLKHYRYFHLAWNLFIVSFVHIT